MRSARDQPLPRELYSVAGARSGHLTELMWSADLRDTDEGMISVDVEHATFEDWWEPFTRGVGPAGAFVEARTPDERTKLQELCRRELGDGPFTVRAAAWAAKGFV